ncbi:MAG TPA: PDZ domain-containing protein [Pyrinomonadaceae bacterium]|nr:PDZ domain-containing protein [Pyrinomonadaceae bacterium]
MSSSSETHTTAPQVVTIVHRINGIKMFRLLLRSEEQVKAIANLDEAFNLMEDVHTNIIAGLALDDGRTIAAWLPDADVEFGPSLFPERGWNSPLVAAPPSGFPSAAMKRVEVPKFPLRGGMFGSPDVTVIGPDGKRLAAEYVGLDGATGLSILRLADSSFTVSVRNDDPFTGEGENITLFNPEPAASTRPITTGSLFVRMGTTFGTVLSVKRAPAGGGFARFKVKSPRLSSANIGGVAVNEAGETVGIVDAVEGPEATILPTALIRRAAKRVLAHQSSVPRPWLGVRGEALARLSAEQMWHQGWRPEQAASLLGRHRGILLTSILPGSPAASASLRAGDVILKVNNEDVENGDDFSWMLDEAGPSSFVTFTLARPNRVAEEAIRVELSGVFDPNFAFGFGSRPTTSSLISQGIETIALRPPLATRLGASVGLLVVYVDPSTPAFEAGLQPGDVIEAIDGKSVSSAESFPVTFFSSGPKSNLDIVRKKQRLVVTVIAPKK